MAFGLARLASAKLQCGEDSRVGRSHSATLVSLTVDGTAQALPTSTTLPALAGLTFKTEYYDTPEEVHAEVYDPSSPPAVRKLHLMRSR
jgi:hypothetical protein